MVQNPDKFRAMVVEQTADGRFERRIQERTLSDLPDGDVLVKVQYSSLNYKDALSAIGNKGVTRHYPHTPGIDAAGEVVESRSDAFKAGEAVLVAGHDMGMETDGGFGRYVRVPADWVLHLPAGMDARLSMMYGTAGFTAGLSLYELEGAGITQESGDILVTGASGGVGSLAVGILGAAGYSVIAATGKAGASEILTRLGAASVVDRGDVQDSSDKPLLKSRFAGAIDTVGGPMLSSAIRSVKYGGAVTCCGNAASPDLQLTVYPFILRAVRLIGIESVACPRHIRQLIWERLAGKWRVSELSGLITEIGLDAVPDELTAMLEDRHMGRSIVCLGD
ncbi:MAG: YhdH/YhfP family quinone oxidoreductase [Thermodesulfobacteriota bacterium]